jgi:hypothetical protein
MPFAHVRETTIVKEGELHLEGIPVKTGDRVQVVIIPKNGTRPDTAQRYPFHGKPLHYDDPFGPACDPEDWEANR